MTLLILILIIIGMVVGFRRGGLLQGLHFIGTLAAVIIARLNYKTLGSKLELIMPYPSSALEVENTLLKQIPDLENAYYYMAAFFFIFIVTKLIIQLLISSFDYLQQIQFNFLVSSIVGLVFGMLEIIYILAVVLAFAATIPMDALQGAIDGSGLAKVILNHTFIISGRLMDWMQI